MKVMAVRLSNYREWTELLGNDREWRIQEAQFKLALTLSEAAMREGTLPFIGTFDKFLLPVDGVKEAGVKRIFNAILRHSPVLPVGCVRGGRTPMDAQKAASTCADSLDPGKLDIEKVNDDTIWLAHFDVNGFTVEKWSFHERTLWIQEMFLDLTKSIVRLGGISQYLGGDNMIAMIDPAQLKEVPKIVEEFYGKLKVGIGAGVNAREASSRATQALTKLRERRDGNWLVIES